VRARCALQATVAGFLQEQCDFRSLPCKLSEKPLFVRAAPLFAWNEGQGTRAGGEPWGGGVQHLSVQRRASQQSWAGCRRCAAACFHHHWGLGCGGAVPNPPHQIICPAQGPKIASAASTERRPRRCCPSATRVPSQDSIKTDALPLRQRATAWGDEIEGSCRSVT